MSVQDDEKLRIDAARLEQNIMELGRIGLNANGGLDRTAFSPAELSARTWLCQKLANLGLAVHVDEAANIWAVRQGTKGTRGTKGETPTLRKKCTHLPAQQETCSDLPAREEADADLPGLQGACIGLPTLPKAGPDLPEPQAARVGLPVPEAREKPSEGLPPLVCGSHIDTVPNGGKYDGALGVLLALEVLTVLNERGIGTRHPLALVSFSAEEPNPFGLSTFGSRSVAGKLGRSELEAAVNSRGERLTDALRKAGGTPERYEECRRRPGDFAAYLEVHIEQGKRLLNRAAPVGIVTGITGIYRELVTVTGEANHAGTTLMNDRADALLAASEMLLAFERLCRTGPDEETVGTVGVMNIEPGAANIIPGKAEFHLELRGRRREHIAQVLEHWKQEAEQIARTRGVLLQRVLLLDQPPVPMDPLMVEISGKQADMLGYPFMALGSMAGHDAAHMAALTRSGMLFVPSLEGKSHCPEEASRMEDIEKAGNVLLHTILALDRRLDGEQQAQGEGAEQ